jgi:hypothetical protein
MWDQMGPGVLSSLAPPLPSLTRSNMWWRAVGYRVFGSGVWIPRAIGVVTTCRKMWRTRREPLASSVVIGGFKRSLASISSTIRPKVGSQILRGGVGTLGIEPGPLERVQRDRVGGGGRGSSVHRDLGFGMEGLREGRGVSGTLYLCISGLCFRTSWRTRSLVACDLRHFQANLT